MIYIPKYESSLLLLICNHQEFEGHPIASYPIIPTACSPFQPDSSTILIGCQDGTLLSLSIHEQNIAVNQVFAHHHQAAITRIVTRSSSSALAVNPNTNPNTNTNTASNNNNNDDDNNDGGNNNNNGIADNTIATSLSLHFHHDSLLSKLVLTASFDWTVALWLPAYCLQPLCTFTVGMTYVTDVAWNPVNPALFAVALASGEIQFWNLLKEVSVGFELS